MELPTFQPHHSLSLNGRNQSNPTVVPNDAAGLESVEIDLVQNEKREVVQLRKQLETETGFASYKDFARTFEIDFFNRLKYAQRHISDYLGDYNVSSRARQSFTVIDVSSYEQAPSVSVRAVGLSATQTLIAVRNPPRDVSVQIILLDINKEFQLMSDFTDVLGLGLRLDPEFVDAVTDFDRSPEPWDYQDYYKQARSTYIQINGMLATISRPPALAELTPPPVVFVAGNLTWIDANWTDEVSQDEFRDLLRRSQPGTNLTEDKPASRTVWSYVHILEKFLIQQQEHDDDESSLLITCLLPVLQLESLFLRSFLCQVSRFFSGNRSQAVGDLRAEGSLSEMARDENAPASLYKFRISVRARVEALEDQDMYSSWFMSSQFGVRFSEKLPYIKYQEDRQLVILEARRLEAEIRDHLQVQASLSALLESRKSIELSNYQIQEGKRVKIFTILAFVYVPLNLATSVFGMNLQQLNQSGRSLRDFVLTAVIALFVTGGSWWLIEEFHLFRLWQKGDSRRADRGPRPNFSIGVRFWLIAWLIGNGHWSWMLQSGAARRILTNSPDKYQIVPGYRANDSFYADEGISAGLYVSKRLQNPKYGTYDDFKVVLGGWRSRAN